MVREPCEGYIVETVLPTTHVLDGSEWLKGTRVGNLKVFCSINELGNLQYLSINHHPLREKSGVRHHLIYYNTRALICQYNLADVASLLAATRFTTLIEYGKPILVVRLRCTLEDDPRLACQASPEHRVYRKHRTRRAGAASLRSLGCVCNPPLLVAILVCGHLV